MPIAMTRGRANRDENDLRFVNGGDHRRREMQIPVFGVTRDQIIETGFENRDFAAQQSRDFFLALIHAGDMNAELGKASRRNKTNIASAQNNDFHNLLPNNFLQSDAHRLAHFWVRERKGDIRLDKTDLVATVVTRADVTKSMERLLADQ